LPAVRQEHVCTDAEPLATLALEPDKQRCAAGAAGGEHASVAVLDGALDQLVLRAALHALIHASVGAPKHPKGRRHNEAREVASIVNG